MSGISPAHGGSTPADTSSTVGDWPADLPGTDWQGHDWTRARRYRRVRMATGAASLAISVARDAWLAFGGRSAALKRGTDARSPHPALRDAVFVTSLSAGEWAAGLPVGFALGHLVERSFGLTRQSPRGWLGERAKGFALGTAIQMPLTLGVFAVVRRRPDDWWLVLAGGALPLTVLATYAGPVLIAPRFNRYVPVEDPALTDRITALAERADVPISAVYRMDMSRQSEKANAFFTGIGATKRIVLADTLMDRFAPDEVEAVVAHEFGHQVHGDIWRLTAITGAAGFALTWGIRVTLSRLLPATAARTGVRSPGDVAGLPLWSLAGLLQAAMLGPAFAAYSRAIERRADRFAIGLTGDGPAYARAMVRLAHQNMSDPAPPRWLVRAIATHPPVSERVAEALATGSAHTPGDAAAGSR
ncbi:MAG: hypothetical protein AVDCRST_MAG70-844 [uncultured Thermomicrobiales bacterium]|uniref:Peptidase M48 domain-containing protein n=1 Tax=uncultured Thermomicrobiales bacterium TaxID=1645740 RepID=A0A6J4UKV5_9BACT|nr:MAG: hypothetical protein AVDCRST_MAG70-844 [uncultured Thermomicrobiales bacterium]